MFGAMKTGAPQKPSQKPSLSPWVIILFTAPVPLMLFVLFLAKWYNQKNDFNRLKSQYVQRQNAVLAFGAVDVAMGFSDLLEKAARDAATFALLPPTAKNLNGFYHAQSGSFTRYDAKNHAVLDEPLPLLYSRLAAVLNSKGDSRRSELGEGKILPHTPLSQCQLKNLCDRDLREHATHLKPGELYYGRVLKYYVPKGKPNLDKGGLSVAYRTDSAILILTIDYLHIRDHLTTPVFPFDSKRDMNQGYDKGNYIFVIDGDTNFISHPHYWNEAGIDPATGTWAVPLKTEQEAGTHPVQVSAYEKGRLKEYFQRLLNISFATNAVDIFRAPNLRGTNRVLSVAPIPFNKGQFKASGIFGHVIVACNIEYFEEPKSRFVPDY